MNATEVVMLCCKLCSKAYENTTFGREQAEACCSCPRCGAKPSKFCSLFKMCRRCDLTVKRGEAAEKLDKARENLALYGEWLEEAGGPSDGSATRE